MSVMQGEVYEAFRAIDVPEDKALRAAEALSQRNQNVTDLKRDTTLLKWMVGILYPLMFAIFLKEFFH